MSIPPSNSLAQLGQAYFKRQMDDCLYQLANNEIAAVASEVHIASRVATVKLASGNKEVTLKLSAGSQPSSGAATFAVDFCREFRSSVGKSVKPNKLVKYAIFRQAPQLLLVNLGVAVFGLLIGLLGRITNNHKMRRMGAELATGVIQPIVNKVFKLLGLGS